MSLLTLTSGIFAIKPKVSVQDNVIQARTPLIVQFVLLFSYSKHVRVDPATRTIQITRRWLWIINNLKIISFDRVSHILYDIGSFGTSWSFFTNEGLGRTDEVERYKVGLALKNPPKNLWLFGFTGEGAVETGWVGTIFGDDDAIDCRGDQDEASYNFLNLLRNTLNVPVNHPPHDEFEENDSEEIIITYHCTTCGQQSPPVQQKCRNCGAMIRPEQTS